MDTKYLVKDALAELMAVDGLDGVTAIKIHVGAARACLRMVLEQMEGVATAKVVGLPPAKEVAHG